MSWDAPKNPPIANRIASTISAQGEQWVDHYAWLRPDNWQEVLEDPTKLPSPIADYLNTENDYFKKTTAHLTPLHDELATEIRGRMAPKRESVPVTDGPFKYRYRFEENAEYPLRVRTDLNGDSEQIVFDVSAAAAGFEYFDFGQVDHSPDHSKLALIKTTLSKTFMTRSGLTTKRFSIHTGIATIAHSRYTNTYSTAPLIMMSWFSENRTRCSHAVLTGVVLVTSSL